MVATASSNRNHIKLSRLHAGLATAYVILFGSLQLFKWGTLTESGRFAVNILSIAMPLLHIGLAWGCKNKSEISRRMSQIMGFLMLLWLPIGTIFGFFLFRFADWKSPPDQKAYVASANKLQSSLHKIGIEHSTLQKFGLTLLLISPVVFSLNFLYVALGFHVFSSDTLLGWHWLSLFGMLFLSPIGLIIFFIGSWLTSKKIESHTRGDIK